MAHDIETIDLEPIPVLFMRRTVAQEELGGIFAECFPAVFQFAMANGVELAGAPFARYRSFAPDAIEVDAGIPIGGSAEGNAEIEFGTLAGGKHVMTIHKGAYETLDQAHSAIEVWLTTNGKSAAGPTWESYVTDPGEEPNPDEWQTFVYCPID